MPPGRKNYWRCGSSRCPKAIGILCLFFWFTQSASSLFAAPPSKRIIIVRPTNHDALFSRIKAELLIAGFSVREQKLQVVPADNDVETALRSVSAYLFIRELTRTIELYYRTSDSRMNHLEIPIPYNEEEEVVTSLHISEILRVAFPSEVHVPSPPAPEPQLPKQKRRIANSLTGHMDANATFIDLNKFPQIGLAFGVGIRLYRMLGISIETSFPLRSLVFNEPTGEATLKTATLGIAANMDWGKRRVRWNSRLGYNLWFVKTSVDPGETYGGASGTEIASGPVVFVGATALVNSRIGVSMGVSFHLLTSTLHYRMAEKKIVSVGMPVLGVSLGIHLLPKENQR